MGLVTKNRATLPWANLPIHVPKQMKAFFAVSVYSKVGDLDGPFTPWPMYRRSCTCLFAIIPKRRLKQRSVQDALTNHTWISGIQGTLTVGVIIDYLHLWDILSDFFLQPEVEDRHIWRFSFDGQYSTKTA
jgi:hypothetical protein